MNELFHHPHIESTYNSARSKSFPNKDTSTEQLNISCITSVDRRMPQIDIGAKSCCNRSLMVIGQSVKKRQQLTYTPTLWTVYSVWPY
jgi:hypothetical protein